MQTELLNEQTDAHRVRFTCSLDGKTPRYASMQLRILNSDSLSANCSNYRARRMKIKSAPLLHLVQTMSKINSGHYYLRDWLVDLESTRQRRRWLSFEGDEASILATGNVPNKTYYMVGSLRCDAKRSGSRRGSKSGSHIISSFSSSSALTGSWQQSNERRWALKTPSGLRVFTAIAYFMPLPNMREQ